MLKKLFIKIAKRFLKKIMRNKYDLFVSVLEKLMHLFFLDPSLGIWIPLKNGLGLLRVAGYSFIIPEVDSFIVREILRDNVYTSPHLGDFVIDIGAHYGIYSIVSAKEVGKFGCIFSFEPYSCSFKGLLFNAKINKIENIHAHNIALGDINGNSKLYIFSNPAFNSTLFKEGRKETNVKIKRLDDVIEELALPRVNLIKIDAEGSELKILRGAENTIRKFKPNLTIAAYHYSTESEEIINWLGAFPYVFEKKDTHLHAQSIYQMNKKLAKDEYSNS